MGTKEQKQAMGIWRCLISFKILVRVLICLSLSQRSIKRRKRRNTKKKRKRKKSEGSRRRSSKRRVYLRTLAKVQVVAAALVAVILQLQNRGSSASSVNKIETILI